MSETLVGGCLCGAVRYEARPPKSLHYFCHCTDCRRHGGGAVHAGIAVAADSLVVTGSPTVWTKAADSGRTIARHFCSICGSHLFTSPWPAVTRYSIKAGSLDDPGAFRPRHEIWCKSRVDWWTHELEGFEEGFTRPHGIGADTPTG
ncbi:MAG: GFA family protein [Pseudomonadota bacterium]